MSKDTPARPALDASKLADKLERLRDRARNAVGQIDVSESTIEFSTAVRMNFDTILAALRSLADMRGALEKIANSDGKWVCEPGDATRPNYIGSLRDVARDALARSAP